MTAAKRRGTETERKVVLYLKTWWPQAERRALAGKLDKGDVINVPRFCIEVKGDRSNRLAQWKGKTLTEQANAGADFCALIVRVDRKGVRDWDMYVPMSMVGVPVTGEDAWFRMPLSAGVALIKVMIKSPACPSSRS